MDVRTKIEIGIAAFIVAILFVCGFQQNRIARLVQERDKYERNTETLLSDVERFKVNDSLNAAKVYALELSVKEFERFRGEDAALIKQLKAKNRDLEAISKAQARTIVELSTMAKDTIIKHDSIPIPALVLRAGDPWYDFEGLLVDKKFTGTMVCRDSLVLEESVRYKRFLWWKTKKVKDRELSVVTKNPHNTILGLEHIVIEK